MGHLSKNKPDIKMSGKVQVRLNNLLLNICFVESQGLTFVLNSIHRGTQPPPTCCACFWDSYYRKWPVRVQAGLTAAVLVVSGLH